MSKSVDNLVHCHNSEPFHRSVEPHPIDIHLFCQKRSHVQTYQTHLSHSSSVRVICACILSWLSRSPQLGWGGNLSCSSCQCMAQQDQSCNGSLCRPGCLHQLCRSIGCIQQHRASDILWRQSGPLQDSENKVGIWNLPLELSQYQGFDLTGLGMAGLWCFCPDNPCHSQSDLSVYFIQELLSEDTALSCNLSVNQNALLGHCKWFWDAWSQFNEAWHVLASSNSVN